MKPNLSSKNNLVCPFALPCQNLPSEGCLNGFCKKHCTYLYCSLKKRKEKYWKAKESKERKKAILSGVSHIERMA